MSFASCKNSRKSGGADFFACEVLLFLSAHLHFKPLGVLDMETPFGGPYLQLAAFQFGFNRGLTLLSVSQFAIV